MDYESTAAVIDTGEYSIKAGYVGDEEPREIFPTLVGRPKSDLLTGAEGTDTAYYGENAKNRQAVLKLSNPINEGLVTNWEDMENMWRHTFDNELRVSSDEINVLLTGVPYGSKDDLEKMAKFMFEDL